MHPTLTGWYGQIEPNAMYIHKHQEAKDASRFQSGTASLSAIYDSVAGLELIKSVGVKKIECWIDYITTLLMDRLVNEGFAPATPMEPECRGAQVAIQAKNAEEAVAELSKRGITSSSRDNNVRTAWHFYNTPNDIDMLIDALNEIRYLMIVND